MSRRFLDDIKADITSMMADNASGDFTLAMDRAIRNDTIDSTVEDEAAIYTAVPVPGPIATTVAFSSLTTGLYDTAIGDDSAAEGFLNTDEVNGTITGSATPGFTYDLRALLSFTPANGVTCDISIGVDGVEGFHIGSTTGQPGGDPATVSVDRIIKSASASSVFTIMVRTPAGVSSLTIVSAALIAIIKPTHNAAP